MAGVTDRRSSFCFEEEAGEREGGTFFVVSVFAELERGQLPQSVVMLPP